MWSELTLFFAAGDGSINGVLNDASPSSNSRFSHYGSKQGDVETLSHTLSHKLRSEQNERASKEMSALERVSKANK